MREVETHEGVARLQAGEEDGHVGLCAGVRLHIGVLCIEEFAEAVDGQLLDLVDDFATAVVTGAGVAFRILVGADAAQGFQHLVADKVFGSDELDAFTLALFFLADQIGYLNVLFHIGWCIVFILFAIETNNIQR